MNFMRSEELYEKALKLIPGGVNSPVRACRAVQRTPVFIRAAEGCHLYDEDNQPYIDYVGSWGPMILGHRHPAVVKALEKALTQGTSFGAPTELEIQLAELIVSAVPSVEMVRMVNSGTEATMSAIRLARGITKRDTIIKFDGCYHGHADSLLVAAGSGVATLNIPGSPGVPSSFVSHTLSLPYNDIDTFEKVMAQKGDSIACVIVEPVAGNMGMVTPEDGFLDSLRQRTQHHGAILIFDEVMTGFRVAYGGAQAIYQVTPDLTCFGKIIGGGLPVGAYGGRRDLMAHMAPEGSVYQAGTLSGNPLAMAAGIASLEALRQAQIYDGLKRTTEQLCLGLKAAAQKAGIPVYAHHIGSMLGLFFTEHKVQNFSDAQKSNLEFFNCYYGNMLERGIYLAPSQFEALFVSTAHGPNEITATIAAAQETFTVLAESI